MVETVRGAIIDRILINDRMQPSQVADVLAPPIFIERAEGSAPGSASLDNALIMRDVAHEWCPLPALDIDGC